MRRSIVALLATVLTGLAPLNAVAQTAPPSEKPAASDRRSDAAIRQILAQRVDTDRQSRGIVVGVIDARGQRVVAHGLMGAGGKPVDGQTLFEIGSVTKVLTSLLLADMVRRGEVRLDGGHGRSGGIVTLKASSPNRKAWLTTFL